MAPFRPFEKEAVRLLVAGRLPEAELADVLRSAELVSCEHTGSGYLLTVRHPGLPANRIVCGRPTVIGRCGEIESGFVVFLEDGELTLECHSWGGVDVPSDVRERQVEIRVAD